MKLIFATHNQNKVKEIQQLVGENIQVLTLNDVGFTEDIDETGITLRENASIKSCAIFNRLHSNCFADDTGLEVETLNGEPGVYSARYAGLQKNDEANMDLLLSKLHEKDNRRARFVTIISLIIDGNEVLFEGELRGEIIDEKRGTNGFGYDPIFRPEGFEQTLAQMSLDEKNKISHRAKAFLQLKIYLDKVIK